SMRDGRRKLHRRGGRDDGRNPADQADLAGRADNFGDFERFLWTADRCAGSGELSLFVLLHESWSGSGDRKYGEARAVCFDSCARKGAGGESVVFASTKGGARRTSPLRPPTARTGGLEGAEQGTTRGRQSISHCGDYGTFPNGEGEEEGKNARDGLVPGRTAGALHHRGHAGWFGA